MQLDSLTVALRPRTNWEAIDLGVAMARTHWKRLILAWLALYVPVVLLISVVLSSHLAVASAIVWWLKPMFDRVPLFMLSRATFGDMPGIGETLKSLLPVWRRNLLRDLTIGRFNMARSFDMPVRDLEGLRGQPARRRLKDLHERTHNSAVWLTLACINFELVVMLSLIALMFLLVPQGTHPQFMADLFTPGHTEWRNAILNVFYYLAIALVEPFYMAAGFALYLNRRTLLEGWDIEIVFRRMAQRIQSQAKAHPAKLLPAWLLAFAVTAIPGQLPGPARADTVAKSAGEKVQAVSSPAQEQFSVASQRDLIAKVMADKDFQSKRLETHWKYIGKKNEPAEADVPAWLKWLVGWSKNAGRVIEVVLWLSLALAVAWVISKRKLWLRSMGGGALLHQQDNRLMFGLDIAPESLPADVPGEALKLWRSGQPRAALSLLYRGALSHMVTQEKIELGTQATEEDCLRLCRRHLAPELGDYFNRITRAWQHMAYAARPIAENTMQNLCSDWPRYLRKAP